MVIHDHNATPHHLTRARHSLYKAQQAALDVIDPRSATCLVDAHHTGVVELVELIGTAITHCEQLTADIDGEQLSLFGDTEQGVRQPHTLQAAEAVR
jgi:hypothetical protein